MRRRRGRLAGLVGAALLLLGAVPSPAGASHAGTFVAQGTGYVSNMSSWSLGSGGTCVDWSSLGPCALDSTGLLAPGSTCLSATGVGDLDYTMAAHSTSHDIVWGPSAGTTSHMVVPLRSTNFTAVMLLSFGAAGCLETGSSAFTWVMWGQYT